MLCKLHKINITFQHCVPLAHIGGLLALFLGASLITCLEFVDIIARCACALVGRRRGRRRADRKFPPTSGTGSASSSNHVMFRPIDSVSDDVIGGGGLIPMNHRDSPCKTTTTPQHGGVGVACSRVPRVKVNATSFRGNNSLQRRQEETDI